MIPKKFQTSLCLQSNLWCFNKVPNMLKSLGKVMSASSSNSICKFLLVDIHGEDGIMINTNCHSIPIISYFIYPQVLKIMLAYFSNKKKMDKPEFFVYGKSNLNLAYLK